MRNYVEYIHCPAALCPTAPPRVRGMLLIDENLQVWSPKLGGGWEIGGSGAAAGTATPEDLGVAAAGTAPAASHEDHVHAMPSAADVGAVAVAAVGAASGICPLGADSRVAALYLPSYVDDVLEYANLAGFPGTGATGIIYVDLATNKTYRWSGSAYVAVDGTDTGTLLTGLSTASATDVAGTDSILSAFGKLQAKWNAFAASVRAVALTGMVDTDVTAPAATDSILVTLGKLWGRGKGLLTSSPFTMNTARLLGRTTASAGAVEEITIGSGLSLSAGVLAATGGGASGSNATSLLTGRGFVRPAAVGVSTIHSMGFGTPGAMDSSTAGGGTATTDGTGNYGGIPRVRYTGAASAVNRSAGVNATAYMQLAATDPTNGRFPLAVLAAVADASPSNGSFFIGMVNNVVGTVWNGVEPSAITSDFLGVGYDSTGTYSANCFLLWNDNTGGVSSQDLGAGFPRGQYEPILVMIDKNSGGTELTVTVYNPKTNAISGPHSVTTNLPRSSQSYHAVAVRSSQGTAFTPILDFGGFDAGKSGASGGSSTFAALTDVTLGTQANGDRYRWDSTSSKFVRDPSVWQTYTPNVSNAVAIAIDAAVGRNVILNAPVDDTQVVNVPLNLADGDEMEIDMVGGDGSGSWATWSSGAPATPGYVFLDGPAPTADASALNCTSIFVKRRGAKYEVRVDPGTKVL